MSITPQALQDLLDELEASKQSRRRAWAALQRVREALCDLGKMNSLPDPKKSFEAEGAVLERAFKLCLEKRVRAIKELAEAARLAIT